MKRSIKVILVLLLAISAFHLSGVEVAFCDESAATQANESHGCMSCQPSHHSVALQQPVISYTEFLVTFFSFKDIVMQLKEPAGFILRPPISL